MSEEKKADLKACPCCGAAGEIQKISDESHSKLEGGGLSLSFVSTKLFYKPKCSSCELVFDQAWQCEADAIEAWNTRPREQELEGVARAVARDLIRAQHYAIQLPSAISSGGDGRINGLLTGLIEGAVSQITAALKEGR